VTTAYDLTTLGEFLARRDLPAPASDRPADLLVLCGSAVLRSLTVAAEALHGGAVERILVTGGVGHSTSYLRRAVAAHPTYADTETAGRTEAAVLAEILVRHLDVPPDLTRTEEESTNCGQNAEYSLRLLADTAAMPRSLVLVQDPTMQRRTHAAFDLWRGADGPEVRSHAPFVPVVGEYGVGEAAGAPADEFVWTLDRFRDLALGEISRLTDDEHGYGPRGAGFIVHVDIPADVAAAHARLCTAYPGAARDLTP
jgi:hypothetical protein